MSVAPLEGKQLTAFHHPPEAEVLVYEGAVRSSKTIVSLMRWVKFIRTLDREKRTGNLLMVGVTVDTLIHNVLSPLEDMLGTKRVKWNRTTGEAEILGRKVFIMGAHDAGAVKRVQGLTLIGAYVDEVANVVEAFWNMLRTRLSEFGALLIATCNPEGPKHWLLVKWLSRALWWVRDDGTMVTRDPGDMVLIDGKRQPVIALFRVTFVLDDNAWLIRTNPGFVASLKASLTGVFYQRNILSKWVSADGAVYGSEFSEERNVITAEQLPLIEQVLMVGVDYGTQHPTRGYALGLGRLRRNDRTGVWVWPGQETTDPTSLHYCLFVLTEFAPETATVGEHARLFREWLTSEVTERYPRPEWIAVDPAALVFKTELWNLGHENVMNAHNSVLSGIQLVASLLQAGRLLIVGSRCPKLVDNLPGYVWDGRATKAGRTEPLKENDDEADALRYSVYTSRAQWRDLIPLAVMDTPDTEPEG